MRKKRTRFLARLLTVPLALSMMTGTIPAYAEGYASPQADSEWTFACFGTSTKESLNKLTAGGITAGTDLSQPNNASISLASCTYNDDGSINNNGKGGKFPGTEGYDGISYYYTKIDAKTQNFYLQADVTIGYINPTPDGQEGFALLARDSIGTHGSTNSFYSNSMATIGTKLTYIDSANQKHSGLDVVGYRCFNGITDAVNPPDKTKMTLDAGGLATATDENAAKLQAGRTYTVSLEETDSGYTMTYYDENGKIINVYTYHKEARGEDPLAVVDTEYQYVGFAVARGCNATFHNIIFRTTDADDSKWEPEQIQPVALSHKISSPSTSSGIYKLRFKTNADGTAKIVNKTTGDILEENVRITANKDYVKETVITTDTTFSVNFKPDDGYKVNGKAELTSYAEKTAAIEVSYRTFAGDTIYVSKNGTAENDGSSFETAVDLKTALNYAAAGQTILLKSETYTLDTKLSIERGIDGTADAYITMQTDPDADEYAVFDFNKKGEGFEIWGNYWHLKRINLTNSKSGYKGCQVSGNHNILDQMNFYNNGTTGLQISGTSAESIDMWPSYNTIKNCTSMNNADAAMEDADGFGAKLTVGYGNVFDGCIAAYNADDGWDLFAKTATGSIGAVTIKNSLAYRNGFLIVKDPNNTNSLNYSYITKNLGASNMPTSSLTFNGSNFGTATPNGPNITFTGTVINSGNGNGFKMGGSSLSGNHVLKNSVSYENKAKGIDCNSCPDIKTYNSISFNNGSSNVALYTGNNNKTDFVAEGLISYRTAIEGNNHILGIGENIKLNQTDTITTSDTNYLWDATAKTSKNAAGTAVSDEIFEKMDTSKEPERSADGAIDMHDLLVLTDKAPDNAGADLNDTVEEDITLWVVGDSTVCAFSDNYYMPRYGWGTQLNTIFSKHVTVKNLAVSGTSSKSFLTNKNYQTLLNGMESGDYLMIGFGHNDEKTEDTTFTDGRGDYQTEGSFAKSLYDNYIAKATEKGVHTVLVTPIARRNASNDYTGASGHITEYGDYAKAIRDLGTALEIPVCDLTTQTIALNTKVDTDENADNDSKYMRAWTSKKESSVDNTHTNLFGAAVNAYLIAQELKESKCVLAGYLKTAIKDPMDNVSAWKEKSVNAKYVEIEYTRPTTTSTVWPSYTDKNGNIWLGSVFGDLGTSATNTNTFELGKDSQNNMHISIGKDKKMGKIASSTDGIAMYYVRIPAGKSFSLKADVTLNGFNAEGTASGQQAFGLMVRDDMYLDTNINATLGDYVVAGTLLTGTPSAYNTFARKAGKLIYEGGNLDAVPQANETVTLEIKSTTDGYSAKYGDNAAVITGYDFALTSIDEAYVYVGMFAARSIDITVKNIVLTINGQEMHNYNSYAEITPPSESESQTSTESESSTPSESQTSTESESSTPSESESESSTPNESESQTSTESESSTPSESQTSTESESSTPSESESESESSTPNESETNGDVSTKKVDIQINKTVVSGKTLPVTKGKTYTLKAVVTPQTASAKNKQITWNTSKPKIATVTSKGKVKIKGTGTVTITATTADGKTARVKLKAKKAVVKVSKLQIKGKKTMKAGQKQKLSVIVTPVTAKNQKVKWKSSNNKVATVNAKGVVTAKKKGTVTITVTAKDNSKKKKTLKIKVTGK